MAKKKLKASEVEQALLQAHGQKTTAADILGVSFPTIERYIAENQRAQEIIRAMRHKRTDMAKLKLDEAIQMGESWAIMFTLRNKIDPDGEFVGEWRGEEAANALQAAAVGANVAVAAVLERILRDVQGRQDAIEGEVREE